MTLQELYDELKELLEAGHNPDANVLIMEQPTYPFENAISGITLREDFEDEDEDEEPEFGSPRAPKRKTSEMDGEPDDVFILEGRQLRYGSKEAWNS